MAQFGNRLYDLNADPAQNKPIADKKTEQRLIENMIRLMVENDSPVEQYKRLNLVEEYNLFIKKESTALSAFSDFFIKVLFYIPEESSHLQ